MSQPVNDPSAPHGQSPYLPPQPTPPQGQYAPPPQGQYAPPPQGQYAPPPQGQYAPPQQGYPQQPVAGAQYGYPPAGGYPVGYAYGGMPRTEESAAISWALGFTVFVPVIGLLAAPIIMASLYSSQRVRGPLAEHNARQAANWALTYLLASVILFVTHFIVLVSFAGTQGTSSFFPLGIPITLWGLVQLINLIVIIGGTVVSTARNRVSIPFAIPFFRA